MSEVAFSLERKLEINKAQVRSWQHQSLVTDKTKFECLDPKCKIPMSCACWEEGTHKREPYFYPTFKKEHPHVFGCNYASPKEIKEAITKEVEQAFESQQKRTEIVLGNPKSFSTTTGTSTTASDSTASDGNDDKSKTKSIRTQVTEMEHMEQSTWYRNLASFVSMYYDEKINNLSPITLRLSFDKRDNFDVSQLTGARTQSSFSRFFHEITTSNVPLDELHIFFGKAKIIKLNNNGLCKIIFTNKPFIKLLFNVNHIPSNINIKKYIGTKNNLEKLPELVVYFEGALSFIDQFKKDGTTYPQLTAIPLTKEFYRSLYFEKI
ncbi:hypothetical protein P7H71_09550 [Lactococcus lactis]|uniref:hypothetical protein n=1 Tax=Lactococcus lactis TaxID=1358 RepID=UPI00288D23CD|nr:hypothetical protein [Lactococcus lactis]MDT2884594.1 hypothetical protein [Lactococcus lactis]MDT2900773.1 hypothetical protein [Lactococcus lactis]MDT2922267.1 hypothetical protein [Lactococcus lactis]MDT2971314.1 hypothetical protein [Lactococcus lactis]